MSTPRPRKQRTPEEIAASVAKAKEVMANQKKRDGIDEVKRGRAYIFITAALFFLGSLFLYYQTKAIEIYIVYAPLIALYVVLGIFYYRNPVVISWIALGVYGTLIVLDAVYDPQSIASGLIWKFIIIGALISSIRSAIKYKDELDKMNKPKADGDILDDELIA